MKKDNQNLNKFTSDFIVSSRGQLDYPGMNTLIPNANGRITMKGVKRNVLGIDDLGNKKIMKPKKEYQFPGNSVYEIPLKKKGGEFKKGLVTNPKKTKKGLASKKYSRSLSATNVLFTENSLFKKPKSRKNKVYNPNAKYYAEGGDTGCPNGQVWSKKDKKCIDLPVFGNSLNNGTFTKLTNLSDGLDIKPLNSFSDFGKIKPKKIPVVEDSFLETLEKDINDFLDNPLKKAAQVSESLKEKGEDPSDALRHSTAGALTAQTIANKTGNIPFISNPLGYLGANIAGIGHELSTLSQAYLDDRPWSVKLQESLEDIYNNSAGANTIFNNNSEKDKINYLLKLTRTNQLPDGYGEERPFRDNPKWTDPYNQKQYGGVHKFDDGGTIYTVKGSNGYYKKVNGKWQVDWNKSGKYQPLSKGDVKARTAVLDKMAKPVLSEEPFNPRALLVNAKTQREKTKDAPKIKVEPISGSIQLKGDVYKKNYDDKGKEIKPITLTVEEGEKSREKKRKEDFTEMGDLIKEYTIDPIINTGKRIYNDPLKFASDIGTTALDISQLGPEAAMTTGSYLFGDKKNYFDVDTDALGTSFDALSIIPAFKMLKGSKNLINNTYKVLGKNTKFFNPGEKPHWFKGYKQEWDPMLADLEPLSDFRTIQSGKNKGARTIWNDVEKKYKKMYYELETQKNAALKSNNKKLSSDIDNKIQDIFYARKKEFQEIHNKNFKSKKHPFKESLGSGRFSTVYGLPKSEFTVKVGTIPEGEDVFKLVKNAKNIKKSNIAVPKKTYTTSSGENVIVMNKVDPIEGSVFLNPPTKKSYEQLLKDTEELKNKGLYLDFQNHNNIVYNPSTGLFNIYDLNTTGYLFRNNRLGKTYNSSKKTIEQILIDTGKLPKDWKQLPNSPNVVSSVNDVPKASYFTTLFPRFDIKNLKTKSGKDWIKKWYSDPDFIKKYKETGKIYPEDFQDEALETLSKYEDKNYIDLIKDKGLSTYIEELPSTGLSYGTPNRIYVKNSAYYPFNKFGKESTRVHELTHLLEKNGYLLSDADKSELLKPFIINGASKDNGTFLQKLLLENKKDYYLDPSEIHARMNQARFHFDLSPGDKFTKEMANEISKLNDFNGMTRYIQDKKAFMDLMNNFWSTPAAVTLGAAGAAGLTKKQYKQGGATNDYIELDLTPEEIQKYIDGGYIVEEIN